MLNYKNETSLLIGNVFMKYYLFDGKQPLVVVFSNAEYLTNEEDLSNKEYSPWGYNFVKNNGFNVITFSCFKSSNWYRDIEFHHYLLSIKNEIIKNFKNRLGYGSSNGAYAVSALGDIFVLNRMLLLNPISTLNRKLVRWETRYTEAATKYEWNKSFYDGATTKSRGYIVYDPIFNLDARHAKRYNPNFIHLKLPGMGHGIPLHLNYLGLLKSLFIDFVRDTICIKNFYKKAKNRRNYDRYYDWLLSGENVHLTSKRKTIIEHFQSILRKKQRLWSIN